jgi:hypothetical protein
MSWSEKGIRYFFFRRSIGESPKPETQQAASLHSEVRENIEHESRLENRATKLEIT